MLGRRSIVVESNNPAAHGGTNLVCSSLRLLVRERIRIALFILR